MNQEDHNTLNENIKNPPQLFSNIDLELIPLLSQIDAKLVSIVKGVRRVLGDMENPDRFHQSANSIRHLTALLIRNAKDRISAISTEGLNEENRQLINKVSDIFNNILSSLSGATDEEKASAAYLEGKFNSLKVEIARVLAGKPTTTKQVLKSYFGKDDELVSLQEFAKKRIKESIDRWNSCHEYFNDVAHYSNKIRIDEEEFASKWEEIQQCVLIVLRPFFNTVSMLDEIIKLEEPPNG